MIEVFAAREAFDTGEISEVRWIKSAENVADELTKYKPCDALNGILDTGILNVKVEQWITRSAATTSNDKMFTVFY